MSKKKQKILKKKYAITDTMRWSEDKFQKSYNSYLRNREKISMKNRGLSTAQSFNTYKENYKQFVRSHPQSSALSNLPAYFARGDIKLSYRQARAFGAAARRAGMNLTTKDFLSYNSEADKFLKDLSSAERDWKLMKDEARKDLNSLYERGEISTDEYYDKLEEINELSKSAWQENFGNYPDED